MVFGILASQCTLQIYSIWHQRVNV